jgi:hypothetical protein
MMEVTLRVLLFITTIASASAGAALAATAARYDDPAPYCAALRTIDRPDARYAGPAVPDWLARSLQQESGASADAPLDFFKHARWRCADGKVLACLYGANIPCDDKADRSRHASAGSRQFCRDNRKADVVPVFAAGRTTVYAWRCRAGVPQIVRQIQQIDRRGYAASFWYPVMPAR